MTRSRATAAAPRSSTWSTPSRPILPVARPSRSASSARCSFPFPSKRSASAPPGQERRIARGRPAAGAGALATGIVEVAWVLNQLRRRLPEAKAHLEWERFTADGSGLFLWEGSLPSGRSRRPTLAMPPSRYRLPRCPVRPEHFQCRHSRASTFAAWIRAAVVRLERRPRLPPCGVRRDQGGSPFGK
jgi:hypothetical protein